LIGNREDSALEFDGEARGRLEVAFKLILLRLAPRIVGEAGKYGKTVGERREQRVSRFKIFSRERGPFVSPPARCVRPHILDRGAQRINIRFGDAERNELAVTIFETGLGAEVVGVAHIDSFQYCSKASTYVVSGIGTRRKLEIPRKMSKLFGSQEGGLFRR
jgi:hypothetical protein